MILTSSAAHQVRDEVRKAYSDCWDLPLDFNDTDWTRVARLRNLNFRASASVTRDDAIEILTEAMTLKGEDKCGGYNAFQPALLEHLPSDVLITIAREHSVCVYVHGVGTICSELQHMLKADESMDASDKGWRLWWD